MSFKKAFLLIALTVSLCVACDDPPGGSGPGKAGIASQSNTSFKVEKVAGGLQVPWSIVWAPDGRMLFTERPGQV